MISGLFQHQGIIEETTCRVVFVGDDALASKQDDALGSYAILAC